VKSRILTLGIRYEHDVVLARQRARQIAERIGFEPQDQTRIATAVSEIARNAFTYAGGGRVEFALEGATAPQVLAVVVADDGPGIAELPAILGGQYRSATGMGVGMLGARRLMDQFEVASEPGRGTRIVLRKLLPRRSRVIGVEELGRIGQELAGRQPYDPAAELQQQNQELLRALQELGARQEELVALNRELEDTNRGVVALYAELDEKADHLRRADDLKSRFLSNMTHEFRTPVNSIQALARMLLDRTDGELTSEQERQVTFIRKAADALGELVNDLLDLAKVEAGKTVVRPIEFRVENLFGALRGMLRPLLVNEAVNLVFEEPEGIPAIHNDEAKVSQILRNFVSNALKFTERGEVRVSAVLTPSGDAVEFRVADTGIGIAPEDRERIFQEFSQVEHPLQHRVRGTGLGLPLCRRLAALLGGEVRVESALGLGSTFTVVIPTVHAPSVAAPRTGWGVAGDRLPILVVEDAPETILLYEKYFAGGPFQVVAVQTLRDAREALAAVRPRALVLDVLLRGEDAWSFLTEVKRRPDAQAMPVVIVSTVDDRAKGLALGADAYLLKPVDRETLVHTVARLTAPEAIRRILVVDDEEISRYVLRQHLTSPQHVVSEAAGAAEALHAIRAHAPHVICMDLVMPGIDGFELLTRLKADPTARDIPVVVITSKRLADDDRRRLEPLVAAVLSKETVSRDRALAAVAAALRERERAA
jgi:signal transduction histidine kinase/CheY-like chemotaxis protein